MTNNEKKRGIYFLYAPINYKSPDGIEKKILTQKRLIDDTGVEMRFIVLEKKGGTFWNYNSAYSNAELIYFRRSTTIDYRFISFFKKLRKDNPTVKIFMEIPTYPYEGEYGNNFKACILKNIDAFYRNRLKKYIDYIVLTGAEQIKSIWGVNAICIMNGIDVQEVVPKKVLNNRIADVYTIGCVAKFSLWHGYERLLYGLKNYLNTNKNSRIRIVMIGDGPELQKYESLVKELELDKYVIFKGRLTGEALDNEYDGIDIGCCSLGRYKSGQDIIGDLKSREFLAKGIPIVCGCKIDILQNLDLDYVLYFSNDDTPINIEKIISFITKLNEQYNEKKLASYIRDDVKELIDISNTYRPVLSKILQSFT